MESVCHHLWSGCDKTLLQDLQVQRSQSHWRLQGCGFFQVLARCPASRPAFILRSCQSVSVLTHGHVSLRPRDRPCFGAKPAQSHSGPTRVGTAQAGRETQGSGWHCTPSPFSRATGSQSSAPEPVKGSPGGRGLHTAALSGLRVLLPCGPNPTRPWFCSRLPSDSS